MSRFLPLSPSKVTLDRITTSLTILLFLETSGCIYRVNSFGDAPDANPGDRKCERAVSVGSEAIAPDGLCTLRAAVMESNASIWKDTIEVPNGLYQLVLPVAAGGGPLVITDGVKIQGAGAANTIIDGSGHMVFHVQNEGLELNNVTIQGGNAQSGGGIRVDAGTSEFNNIVVRQNEAFTGGGGLLIDAGATLTIRRSAIINNFAQGLAGGGIWNAGELWVYDSTIANNDSNRAGGIANTGQMNLRNTTVSGNLAHSPEAGTGGIHNEGFAVLNNVTITNNTGVGNKGTFIGGGIQTQNGKTTVLKNSIIAGNHGGTGPNDCVGELSGDSKYNLIGDSNGCTIPAFVSTFLLDVDPLLGPLTSNGGPTQTHLPAGDSPVLETAYQFPPPAADACEPRDQRGVPRPQGAGVCDMGAIERTSANTFVTGFTLVNAASNTDIHPLLHGDTLVLSELPPQLSIRADVAGTSPGSVVFGYDATPSIKTENVAPYALGGDDPAGDYIPFGLSTGSHILTATPFAATGGGGAAGGSQTITFTVQN